MNMKTLASILMLATSLSAFAQDTDCSNVTRTFTGESQQEQDCATTSGQPAPRSPDATPNPNAPGTAAAAPQQTPEQQLQGLHASSDAAPNRCRQVESLKAQAATSQNEGVKQVIEECNFLKKLGNGQVLPGDRNNNKASSDGKITCKEKASYTADYEPCENALKYYTAVVVAEQAMNLQQTIRTDLKNQSIQKKTQEEMASGASQTAMFDAASASNNHQKGIQQEKMIAYSAAVAALVKAHMMIPTIAKIKKDNCTAEFKYCDQHIARHKGSIAANGDAKNALMSAIMEFTAKGVAAGIAMGQYGNAAKQIDQAKASITDDQQDMMMEACVLNPTDPACAKTGTRVAGQTVQTGDFGFGGDSGNNSFNLGGESEVVPEMGAETNLGDNAPISNINSPFADDAKIAKGILDPAAAAQMQASGGAQGGGGGGAGGGMGGGGASLGSDLNGANKDGDKEAQIKTNKVSGQYANGGGGGFKGVGKSKDDANPFASLFDAKGAGGGVEEDRSIASGDIDGASSGLFQKISKRYNQIQADKRIEAKNLE